MLRRRPICGHNGSPPPPRIGPDILVETLSRSSAVVTLDGLVNEVWEMAPSARIFSIAIEELHSPDRATTFELPKHEYEPGRRLCIYLLIASLPHWGKLRNICDTCLAAGGLVQVVFREQDWALVQLRQGANGWMLSELERNFPTEQYTASIALVPATPNCGHPLEPASRSGPFTCRGFIVSLGSRENGSSAGTAAETRGKQSDKELTAVVPTLNRVGPCVALVRFLHYCGFEHRIVVADLSSPEQAEILRARLAGLAEYQSYDYGLPQYQKTGADRALGGYSLYRLTAR